MASPADSAPHIVVLPFAQQGHINPLLQLSRNLASHSCLITFVLSENTLPSSTSIPNLSFVGIPDLLPPERSRGSDFRDSVDSMVNMEAGFRSLLHRLHRLRLHPVSFIIADAFMTWSQSIADEFSIPFVSFFTSSTTRSALCYRLPSLIEKGALPFPRGGKELILYGEVDARRIGLRRSGDEKDRLPKEKVTGIPGVPDMLPEDFPPYLTLDETHFGFQFLKSTSYSFQKASAVIVNSFQELEKEAVESMKACKRYFTVGPLLLLSGEPISRLDANYWPEDERCLPWLDKQSPGSVIYISLGSVASLSVDQFKEFAAGIEASQQAFLWVVRRDSIDRPLEEALPEGFLERTHDRGLIITWGPQLLVLSHPAVGAFLTHCGWNSFLENLATGGVPMICWPHVAEQRMNRNFIVESCKVGLAFQHEEDGSVSSKEVARVLREIMVGEQSQKLHKSARELGSLAKKAVAHGGSSFTNFQSLLKYLFHPS